MQWPHTSTTCCSRTHQRHAKVTYQHHATVTRINIMLQSNPMLLSKPNATVKTQCYSQASRQYVPQLQNHIVHGGHADTL